MSLYLYFSTSLENLANKLAEDIDSSSNKDPFTQQTVIVPNQSIKQWLQLQIAKKNSVTANIEFPVFEVGLWNMVQHIDQSTNPINGPNLKLLDEKLLALFVMFWLQDTTGTGKKNTTLFDSYIRDEQGINSRKIWQLSTRLATLLGHYEYHRTHWLENWRENHKFSEAISTKSMSELEDAERSLFYDIFGPDGIRTQIKNKTQTDYNLISEYAARILNSKSKPASKSTNPQAPIHIFGMTRLTPRDLNCLFSLGAYLDIHMYQFSVCCEFWEDIPTRSQQRQLRALEFKRIRKLRQAVTMNDQRPNLSMDLLENPLLQAWGHAGRETMVLLSEYEERYQNQVHCEGEWLGETVTDDKKSVLQQLQYNIMHRLSGEKCMIPDKSLQIVACPSSYREVEMVYNTIIHTMETDPDLKLTEIAIMVTDINNYKSALEYVFSGKGHIPYNLIDGNATVESIYGQALISMLNLAAGNFTRKDVFDVIFNPCFLAGVGVSRTEAMQWLEWADTLGIFREFENRDEKASIPFSWQHGLTRLRLGRIMTTASDHDTENLLVFQNLAPYEDMESGDQEVIGRFSLIIESLYNRLISLKSANQSMSRWQQCIHDISDQFLNIPSDRPGELIVRKNLFDFFQKIIFFDQLNIAANTIPLQLLVEMIKSELINIPSRKGTFLARGVTILSLRPMRPIPFKLVYILGMKEGDFPGKSDDSMLDLRRSFHPKPGDVNLADANRYTFLETLMAVQEKLYISYVSSDLKKEEDFYPCSVLKQLIHYLNNHILTQEQPVVALPLKGSSIYYLDASLAEKDYTDVFVNFSRSDKLQALADIADRLGSPTDTEIQLSKNFDVIGYKDKAADHIKSALPPFTFDPINSQETPNSLAISLRELARFLENPVEAGLRFHLRLVDDQDDTRELEENEPFFSIFPHDWQFEIEVLETFISRYTKRNITPDTHLMYLDKLHNYWQQCSLMPANSFGDIDRQRFADRITERISGSSKIKVSIIDLLNENASNHLQLVSNVTIGNVDLSHKHDLQFPPLVLDVLDSGREQLQLVELSGSLPFAWQNSKDGQLNACLKITTKSDIKSVSSSKHIIEPFLFLAVGCAAGIVHEGTEFTIYLSHKKGIFSKTYRAWSKENAQLWLTELVSSYLGHDAFDLLPYSIIANARSKDIKPWTDNNPGTSGLEISYQQQLANAIETASNTDYNPPDILKLVNPIVPEDAFTKVRDRLGPILE